MKPGSLDLHRPETVEDVLSVLSSYGDEAKPLAGGQSLVPLLALRMTNPRALIDLNHVPRLALKRLSTGELIIGAMVRHRAIEDDPRIATACAAIADAVPMIGHVAIRNRGTVGGSIAHADPAAEWPTICLLLDGIIEATGPRGVRQIRAEDFFLGFLSVALEPDELLTAVRLKIPGPATGTAFGELARRHGDYALVGIGAHLKLNDDNRVGEVRICLTGVGTVPTRVPHAEAGLIGQAISDSVLATVGDLVAEELNPPTDLQGDADYRKQLSRVLTKRVLPIAAARAREGAGS